MLISAMGPVGSMYNYSHNLRYILRIKSRVLMHWSGAQMYKIVEVPAVTFVQFLRARITTISWLKLAWATKWIYAIFRFAAKRVPSTTSRSWCPLANIMTPVWRIFTVYTTGWAGDTGSWFFELFGGIKSGINCFSTFINLWLQCHIVQHLRQGFTESYQSANYSFNYTSVKGNVLKNIMKKKKVQNQIILWQWRCE